MRMLTAFLISFLGMFSIMYLGISWSYMEFNPMNWTQDDRVGSFVSSLCIAAFFTGALEEKGKL